MSKVFRIHPHYVENRSATIPHGNTTTLGTERQIIKANTNLSATLADNTGLLAQSVDFIQ